MSHTSLQAVGFILDNYADAIEGGNTYRGSGTSRKGIPGAKSNDPEIRDGTDSSITSSGSGSTTVIKYASGDWPNSRWVKTDTPGFWVICTSASGAQNLDAARRITAWDNTAKQFTVDAFPESTIFGDEFTIAQGFKRLPNQIDIDEEDTEVISGFDRMFHLMVASIGRLDFFGNNTITYKAELQLRLRIQKFGRMHDAAASAMENLSIIRALLTLPENRESTYTRALVAEEGQVAEIVGDDRNKVVVLDRYSLIYRISKTSN